MPEEQEKPVSPCYHEEGCLIDIFDKLYYDLLVQFIYPEDHPQESSSNLVRVRLSVKLNPAFLFAGWTRISVLVPLKGDYIPVALSTLLKKGERYLAFDMALTTYFIVRVEYVDHDDLHFQYASSFLSIEEQNKWLGQIGPLTTNYMMLSPYRVINSMGITHQDWEKATDLFAGHLRLNNPTVRVAPNTYVPDQTQPMRKPSETGFLRRWLQRFRFIKEP